MEVQQIEVARISEDPAQPRKQQSEEALQGLADSIRQHGMLNPITVMPFGDSGGYRIVTGERRWRAAQMAHLTAIPCIVKTSGLDDTLTEQLIENLQREDLQPIEKARAIQHVRKTLNLTNREIARRLGLSERTVGYLLDLLALPEAIAEAVVSSPNRPSDGNLTEKHARFLKQLNSDPETQQSVVDRIRDEKMTGEETGNLVKALKKHPERTKEILESPNDHLERFFQDDPDPVNDLGDPFDTQDAPRGMSPYAQQVLEFLPRLSGVQPAQLPLPEVRQLEDALTSLQLAVTGLLHACKERLGEKV